MNAKTPNQETVTWEQAVTQVLAEANGPIPMDELLEGTLAIRPTRAKNPMSHLRTHLRWEHNGRTLVFLDPQVVVPLRIVMQGVRFRIPLSFPEVKRKVLFIRPAFDYFLRWGIEPQAVQLLDESGHSLPARVVTISQSVSTPWGLHTEKQSAFELRDWFRARRIRSEDSILVTVEDWEAGYFCLEHEPVGRRRQEEVEQRNQELADTLFELLENSHHEEVMTHVAIPTAYARLSNPRAYPGDHWMEVLEWDPRMRWAGSSIRYADVRSPLDKVIFGKECLPEEPFAPAQARQVYRFKAALWHRPGLWRRIEIQGEQTLSEFDAILRSAFEHDPFDHLGGFWKRVRRGTGKKFREVDLGDIHPLGGGEGADRCIAGLGLQPGGELKYVYDFGDWIEHRITLEEVVEPEEGAKYPRIVAQNRPRYRNCRSCEEQGRKVRATWVCLQCSNEQQQDVLLCEDCVTEDHEDHYAEEILY